MGQDRERSRAQAAEWVVRLYDGVGPAEQASFELWRASSPGNDLAYERALAAWTRFDAMPIAGAIDAPSSHSKPAFSLRFVPSRSGRWAVAASFVLLCLGAAVVFTPSDPAYATALGETRLLTLPDRSQIQLNSDSAVRVHLSGKIRRIELVKGEIFVAPSEGDSRAFVVTSAGGNASFQAGTGDVRLDGGTMLVRAVDRPVRVESASGESASFHVVSVGQEVRYAPGSPPQVGTIDDVSRVLAWRQGAIDLRGQSLAEAAAEFNRYNVRKITLVSSEVGGYRLGGYFRTNDVDGFVRAVQTAFPVRAQTVGNHVVLSSRRGS